MTDNIAVRHYVADVQAAAENLDVGEEEHVHNIIVSRPSKGKYVAWNPAPNLTVDARTPHALGQKAIIFL